ncbi:MAG: hypothetical protein CL566_05320 [Alphaproteobacteria bacterium]|nr:hypothetical protein [Alphaproteobacteria bacterium]
MAGVTDEELEVIQGNEYMNSDLLTAREKATLLWTEHVTLNTAKNREDVFNEVSAVFSEPEIVELTTVCAFRNMRNRMHDSLHLDPDPAAGAEAVGAGSQVSPDALKAYLQHLLENWPDEFPTAPSE